MGKKKVPNKITKRGNCPKTHNYNIGNFCMNEKGYETFEKEKRVAQQKCRAKAKAGVQPYGICYQSFFPRPRKYKPTLDKFVYKNKIYVATQECQKGQNMYWVITGLFRKKVSEMGCMTTEQFKMAKMEMEIKGLKRAIRTNALNDASNTINNMIQQQQINTNTYNSNFGF